MLSWAPLTGGVEPVAVGLGVGVAGAVVTTTVRDGVVLGVATGLVALDAGDRCGFGEPARVGTALGVGVAEGTGTGATEGVATTPPLLWW